LIDQSKHRVVTTLCQQLLKILFVLKKDVPVALFLIPVVGAIAYSDSNNSKLYRLVKYDNVACEQRQVLQFQIFLKQ